MRQPGKTAGFVPEIHVGRVAGIPKAEVLSRQVRAAPPTGFARYVHRTMTDYWKAR